MRQIKFRAKDTFKSKFFPQRWLYGTPVQDGDNMWMCVKKEDKGIVSVKVDSDTLGQFTGLTDCNGKEIYEGDSVRYYDDIEDELVNGVVTDAKDHCSFVVDAPAREILPLNAFWKFEVIGNIHDNPELFTR